MKIAQSCTAQGNKAGPFYVSPIFYQSIDSYYFDNMDTIRVTVDIPRWQYLLWYKGLAREVSALASDGRSVRFPADILLPFLTHGGVKGTFIIQYTSKGKFSSVRQVL